MAHDGTFYSELSELDDVVVVNDHFEIHYRYHAPGRHYLERVAPDERAMLVVAIVLVCVTVVATITSFVLLLF